MEQPQTQTVYDLFNGRIQLVVPVYQRAYVWNEYENWAILWDDIADIAERHLDDPTADLPLKHFLGPVVLDQQRTVLGQVDRRLIIDGQQRLTTLQILLSAAKACFEELGAGDDAAEFADLVANKGKVASGEGRYKVLPSRRDREAFFAVLDGKRSGKDRLSAAYRYFGSHVEDWVTRDGEADNGERQRRIETLREALDSLLYVVSINLDPTDNAQVIFETLNARGSGLGALDLVKNSALLAAERQGHDAQLLNDQHWEPTFEADTYWQEEARQGRSKRARSDWFLMHWLAVELGRVIRVDTLFDTFRKEILREDPPMDELVARLCSDARTMRSFDDFEDGTADKLFFDRLDALDTTTMMPVALLLYRSPEVTSSQRRTALDAIESWLVRRAILRLQARDYNRMAGRLITTIKKDLERADEVVVDELRTSQARTTEWPSDEAVRFRLLGGDLYYYVSQSRVRMLLEACERDIRDPTKTEKVPLPADLSIEHAMPQDWEEHWPFPPGMDFDDAVQQRWMRINQLGNLTLVTKPLNSSLSNSPWEPKDPGEPSKRKALANASVLLINQQLVQHETWDEQRIDERGADLAERILRTWPGPDDPSWPQAAGASSGSGGAVS